MNDGLTTDELDADNRSEHLETEDSTCDAVQLELRVSSANGYNGPNENASCSFENLGYNSTEMYKKVPTKVPEQGWIQTSSTSSMELVKIFHSKKVIKWN